MPGFFETLTLLKAGYSKKEIDAMVKQDQEQPKEPEPKEEKPKEPEPKEEKPKEPEEKIDYEKLYNDTQKELDELKKNLSDLQDENIHRNLEPDLQKKIEEQNESLKNVFRSFM